MKGPSVYTDVFKIIKKKLKQKKRNKQNTKQNFKIPFWFTQNILYLQDHVPDLEHSKPTVSH